MRVLLNAFETYFPQHITYNTVLSLSVNDRKYFHFAKRLVLTASEHLLDFTDFIEKAAAHASNRWSAI